MNGAGNVALLRELGATSGFDVEGLELVDADRASPPPGGSTVSSTAIRQALQEGDLDRANAWLGRPHEVRGPVQHGDERGRDLGFPTANVAVPDHIQLPADGIYAGWYERPDGAVHPTAISLGRRPTFYEDAPASLLEAHLLDFDGDLYDELAAVRFVARLRGEQQLRVGRGPDRPDATRLCGGLPPARPGAASPVNHVQSGRSCRQEWNEGRSIA